jgi:F0F1-type ATP synthase delta subunit
MKAPRTKIADVIAGKTLSSGVSKKLAREVAAYLLETKRADELNSILRDVQLNWVSHGIVEVQTVSAFPVNSEVEKDIKNVIRKLYPDAKKIILSERRDPAMIGGVRLEFADQQLDLSIESKLNKFKQLTASGKE